MNKYEKLSQTRKDLQKRGEAPEWMTTAGYQIITENNYIDEFETPKDMYKRIAKRASDLINFEIPADFGYDNWFDAFFDVMWKGWLSPSTPVLTNMGNNRGHPVSCSGTYLEDSIRSFYLSRTELAQLTQRGYGTSWGLDNVRARGSKVSSGGEANGIMQPAKGAVEDMRDVAQNTRRGSVGQYLNPEHPDFEELYYQLLADDIDWNIGWNITDNFEKLLIEDPEKGDNIWTKMMQLRMVKGKGYQFYIDKVNRARPKMYVDRGLFVNHSNLCSEITLFNDKNHSFTCVLSSMNVSKYDEWKDTKAIQIGAIFLDAVIDDMLIKAKKEEGFERIVNFTEKTRAIGLGILGEATYYQDQNWIFGDFNSIQFNQRLLKEMDRETLTASKLLAKELGEPEWMKGYGERWSHRIALPPTKSTAIIMGGISEGINPVYANCYEQDTAAGGIYRINPSLLKIMKDRGMYKEEIMSRISESQGSVQGEDWLTDHEKKVFRTAFELNQETILLMGSHRQKIMTQGGGGQSQSLNLFINKETDEEYITKLHWLAYKDPWLLSLYYVHSTNEESAYKMPVPECAACEG